MAGQANSTNELQTAYERIHGRIAEAADRAGRKPEDVVMVAVTKTAGPDQIRRLVEMGQTDLGEGRVQQLTQRAAQLNEFLERKQTLGDSSTSRPGTHLDQVRWHMVGHLQRNKVKQVAPLVCLIHSVDSMRLAEELHAYGARVDQTLDVLLQVNSGGEEQKHGIAPPAARHVAEQIGSMVHLRLRGLMTMAPYTDNAENSRSVFQRCAETFHDIRSAGHADQTFNILSMGMSDDFEVAIEEGSNLIRVGRALFGEGRG